MTPEQAIERIAVELESAAQTDEAESASVVAYWRILAREVMTQVVETLLAEERRAGAEQAWDEGVDWAMTASGQFTGDLPNPYRADQIAQDQP